MSTLSASSLSLDDETLVSFKSKFALSACTPGYPFRQEDLIMCWFSLKWRAGVPR